MQQKEGEEGLEPQIVDTEDIETTERESQPLLDSDISSISSLTTFQVPIFQKLIYGCGQFSLYIVSAIEGFFLLDFLLDVANVSPFFAGAILLISQVWDGITDPIVGRLSDITRTQWGQRRPWIFVGAPFLGLFYWLLWQTFTTSWVYYLFMTVFLHTSTTLVMVPYSALTPDLTNDYHDRTSLTSFRFAGGIIGSLIGTTLHSLLITQFKQENVLQDDDGDVVDYRKGYSIAATVFVVLVVLPPLLVAIFIDPPPKDVYRRDETTLIQYLKSFLNGLYSSLKNKPFVSLLLSYLLTWLVTNFVQANLILWIRYVLRGESHFVSLLIILQISIIIGIFVWNFLSRRYGKKEMYLAGIALTCCVLAPCYFLEKGDIYWLYPLAFFAGQGIASGMLLPWSMLSDVIDYDEYSSHVRREGDLYALFLLFQKIGLGISLIFSSYALGFAGFQSHNSDEREEDRLYQPEHVITLLKLILSFIPIAANIVAVIPMYFYPIDAKMHRKILHRLTKRNRENYSQQEDAPPITTLDSEDEN